jgi:E3 ubiquitin ligase
VTVNLGGGAHTLGYRYEEKILPVDLPVYVLGAAQEDGQVGAPFQKGEGERFLMSYRSEEQLEKTYKRDALWQGLVAVGLFLFGLIFLAVGVGSAVYGA